jgi:hypothetical protein
LSPSEDRDRLHRFAQIGASVVFGAITRVVLGVRAAVGVLDAGITLDPAAAEVFILHGLELLESAALDRAERLKLHDIPQYHSQKYAATPI